MMKTILIAAATILQAYLLGSVDTGILVSKFVYHDDVRNHGSGAAGMTNMLPTGMVSLGSVTMAALYPVLTIIYGSLQGYAAGDMLVCAIGSGFMSGMVIYMHRANIQRIREGKEYRFGKHNKK